MFCYSCGKQLPDDAKFCPSCGAKILRPTEEAAGSQPSPAQAPQTPATRNPRLSKPIKLALGGCALAALILVGVIQELDSDDRLAKPLPASQSSSAEAAGSGPDEDMADAGGVTAEDSEASITLPDPARFYQLNDNEVSVGDDSKMFYLHGDAAEVLRSYAALLEESPYNFQPDEEYPWRLELSQDDVLGGYNLTDPRQEDCTISVGWYYDASLDFTQVRVDYDGAEAVGPLRWEDSGTVSSESVTGLDYDKSHTALQAETEARSQANSDSGSSDSSSNGSSGSSTKHDWSFSSQCISCSGSGTCRQCGGTGYVYETLPGTTERVQVNCTSCYSPGKCRDCGGTGRR